MLAFNNIGSLGRLGNQMFEYAALRGIAANRKLEWAVPPPGTSGVDEFGTENNYCMFETFKLPHAKNHGLASSNIPWCVWKEFHFNDEIFNFRRIRLAPSLVLFGFGLAIYSIFVKSKSK